MIQERHSTFNNVSAGMVYCLFQPSRVVSIARSTTAIPSFPASKKKENAPLGPALARPPRSLLPQLRHTFRSAANAVSCGAPRVKNQDVSFRRNRSVLKAQTDHEIVRTTTG